MNILVTGAAGFIGSHVCEHFIRKGYQIIGVDNFDDFYPAHFKKLNLLRLIENSNFRFHEIDIRDEKSLSSIFSVHKIDVVIHLAAKAGVRPSIQNIEEYYDVNVNGTISLLECMRSNQVNKLLEKHLILSIADFCSSQLSSVKVGPAVLLNIFTIINSQGTTS